jgi:hypothetical protein
MNYNIIILLIVLLLSFWRDKKFINTLSPNKIRSGKNFDMPVNLLPVSRLLTATRALVKF